MNSCQNPLTGQWPEYLHALCVSALATVSDSHLAQFAVTSSLPLSVGQCRLPAGDSLALVWVSYHSGEVSFNITCISFVDTFENSIRFDFCLLFVVYYSIEELISKGLRVWIQRSIVKDLVETVVQFIYDLLLIWLHYFNAC